MNSIKHYLQLKYLLAPRGTGPPVNTLSTWAFDFFLVRLSVKSLEIFASG